MRSLACAAALVLAACVGDRAELGGVDNRLQRPTETRACRPSELTRTARPTLRFPGDALMFAQISESDFLVDTRITYDLTEEGVPVNIAYAGPAADSRHATKQKVIRAAVDVVKGMRFSWNETPAFATDCVFILAVEWRENPIEPVSE